MQQRISFAEPERLTEIFDSETRQEWQNTNYILNCLALKNDTVIADLGAGTGYFSSLFAETADKVYALDCEPNMVSHMVQRFEAECKGNVEARLTDALKPCLPDAVDVVFLANVYRFIEQRDLFLNHLYQQADKDTEFVFVDLDSEHARVGFDRVVSEVRQAGFEITFSDRESCPSHYVLKFRQA
ncbi:class I SAM-dependent methyltransferase [Endozoicomonas sp. OPT23]|uniref:class I SAM-dependent methyltransferase n=1 Tax=Endozoicomonas sp. OPT23 TaxID=2072845 RepID=UPI00129B2D90|nr:class I SAM-dependent methyltransferase [Endozoicomonas sp. OPT23]MRI35183.1 class I SAM-dependent methyltransferase [Endozoicomonas sp. OPT23]